MPVSVALLAATAVVLSPAPDKAAVAFGLLGLAVLSANRIFGWRGLTLLLFAAVLVIPARQYAFPSPLSFALEPYRVAIGVFAVAMALSLSTDRSFKPQALGFGGLLGAILLLRGGVTLVDTGDLMRNGLFNAALNDYLGLATIFLAAVLVRQTLRSRSSVLFVLQALVLGAAGLSIAAVIEQALGRSLFNNFQSIIPFLVNRDPRSGLIGREEAVRAAASSQHPIAFGVMLMVLIPVAVLLIKHGTIRGSRGVYPIAIVLMALGAVSTVSRTVFVMAGIGLLAALFLRPKIAFASIIFTLPIVAVGSLALSSQFTALQDAFTPEGGLAAEQRGGGLGVQGSGRAADFAPTLALIRSSPILGNGYESQRITRDPESAPIVDNQYLATALAYGVPAMVAVFALALVPAVRMCRLARRVHGFEGDLAAALAVAFLANAASWFLYDSFAFIQTMVVFLMLVAISGWLWLENDERVSSRTA